MYRTINSDELEQLLLNEIFGILLDSQDCKKCFSPVTKICGSKDGRDTIVSSEVIVKPS